jgi:hypothetical protein
MQCCACHYHVVMKCAPYGPWYTMLDSAEQTSASTMSSRPPMLLVPALVASSVLVVALQWNSSFDLVPKLLMLPPVGLVYPCTLAFDFYYLYRIYLRRHMLYASYRTSNGPWPQARLLQDQTERVWFATLAGFLGWLHPVLGVYLIIDDVTGMNPIAHEQDAAKIHSLVLKKFIRLSCTYLQAAALAIVAYQTSRLKKEEDNAACQVSHDWQCSICGASQGQTLSPKLQSVQQVATAPASPAFARIWAHLTALLTLHLSSAALSAAIVLHFWPVWWMVIPVLTVGHNLYSLYHISQAVRDPALRETWPRTRLLFFSNLRISGLAPTASLSSSYIIVPVVLSDGRDLLLLAQADARWASVYALQTFALTALSLLSWWIVKQEVSCICVSIGHTWKCSQGCETPAPIPDTVSVPHLISALGLDIDRTKEGQTVPL